jgi:NTE family protein
MLFHLGALWRLNEWGYLPKLARLSSVSGGSITAAVLGSKWAKLAFDANGVGRAFDAEVVQPIRALAGRTIDEGSIISGMVLPGSIADKVTDAYRKHLFGYAALQALPLEQPRFVTLESVDQERLINWGYAICDAAMRKWVDSTLGKPIHFPYPASGI